MRSLSLLQDPISAWLLHFGRIDSAGLSSYRNDGISVLVQLMVPRYERVSCKRTVYLERKGVWVLGIGTHLSAYG